MYTNAVLPEVKTFTLEAEKKIGVVGANEAGISKHRPRCEGRCDFMDVGSVKGMKELPFRNYQFIIVNGRIPEDVLDHIQTISDRSKANTMLLTANSGSLVKMVETFPENRKGLLTFEVPDVIQTIELNTMPIPFGNPLVKSDVPVMLKR